MASDKITTLDRQIAELTELRSCLAATLAHWNARLERTPSGKRAGLLESFAEPQQKGTNRENPCSNPGPHLDSRLQPPRRRSIHNGPRPAAKHA
jgi:hypothetical protein